MASQKRLYGLMAQYETPADVFHACEKVRDSGYKVWDSFTPFPVHNLDKAMGMKRSFLPWIVFIGGMTGAICGITLQWWTSAVDYPVIIAAKPYFSYQAFVPVTFELGILFSAFSSLLGMLAINRLPQFYHPLFSAERFKAASDDKFFIAIESRDPKFDPERTRKLLESTGASHVEEVED